MQLPDLQLDPSDPETKFMLICRLGLNVVKRKWIIILIDFLTFLAGVD